MRRLLALLSATVLVASLAVPPVFGTKAAPGQSDQTDHLACTTAAVATLATCSQVADGLSTVTLTGDPTGDKTGHGLYITVTGATIIGAGGDFAVAGGFATDADPIDLVSPTDYIIIRAPSAPGTAIVTVYEIPSFGGVAAVEGTLTISFTVGGKNPKASYYDTYCTQLGWVKTSSVFWAADQPTVGGTTSSFRVTTTNQTIVIYASPPKTGQEDSWCWFWWTGGAAPNPDYESFDGWALITPQASSSTATSNAPVADGTTIDGDKDGVVDGVVLGVVAVGFDHLYWPGELRGVYEFDLRVIRDQAGVGSASLMIPVDGTYGWVSPNPEVTLYTGAGDGVVDPSDFAMDSGGRNVNVYTYGSAIYLDVTADVQNLREVGAEFMTIVIRPNPASADTAAAFYFGNTVNAQYGFQEAQLSLLSGHAASIEPKGSLLVVENVRFPSATFCSLVVADITNYGNAVEPWGWSITFEVPELGIATTFSGQQSLVPSQRRTFFHNPQITTPGYYTAIVSVGDASSRTYSGGTGFKIPCEPAP